MRFLRFLTGFAVLCAAACATGSAPQNATVPVPAAATNPSGRQQSFYSYAPTPPMGWKSYDAFGDSVTEEEVLANATYMKDKLLSHGWNYVVIDFRWYDPEPTGDDHALNQKRTGAKLSADEFGRMVPAQNRFPSAKDGKGFKHWQTSFMPWA